MVLSTNSFSSLRTSFLKASLCSQQSNGLLSLILKQFTSSLLAFSVTGSSFSSFFRLASFFLSPSTSLLTVSLVCLTFLSSLLTKSPIASNALLLFDEDDSSGDSSDDDLSPDKIFELESLCSFSSSEVNRDWNLSSMFDARVESDCSGC
jgi:hypothetical protein